MYLLSKGIPGQPTIYGKQNAIPSKRVINHVITYLWNCKEYKLIGPKNLWSTYPSQLSVSHKGLVFHGPNKSASNSFLSTKILTFIILKFQTNFYIFDSYRGNYRYLCMSCYFISVLKSLSSLHHFYCEENLKMKSDSARN